jgi:hypothetical protein
MGGINLYAYVDNRPLTYRDPSGLHRKPQKYHGDLDDLCDTDNCKELAKDILTLEVSLYMRDYVEREVYGGKLDADHERRIRDEDRKLEECRAKYLAKCRGCDPPKIRRIPNRETSSERSSREAAERHRNIAIGAAAVGAFAIAGVVAVGGAAAAAFVLVF